MIGARDVWKFIKSDENKFARIFDGHGKKKKDIS